MGAGRLGTTLALALEHAGYRVVAVSSRKRPDAVRLAARLQGARVCSERAVWAAAPLVLLTVPDDELPAVVQRAHIARGQAVVHCSGALGLSLLDEVAQRGGLRGCLHPLQSFPERFGERARFTGIHCGVEADGALEPQLKRLVRALGARPLSLRGVDRARYHAAAVFASNYLVALHAAAEQAWELAGLPRASARAALVPLSRGAITALAALPIERALTGPLARGDRATIAGHLRALAPAPELRRLYADLGRVLLSRPLRLPAGARALRALLAGASERPVRRSARGKPRGRRVI